MSLPGTELKMSEAPPEIVISLDDVERQEAVKPTEYYLDREDIRIVIEENWPELLEKIDNITHPRVSNNPDPLEKWEVEQRNRRWSEFSQMPPLYALQMYLYEESFASHIPKIEPEFSSYAPTPGGLLSHGYIFGTHNEADIESVAKYHFVGETAREAVQSLSDWNQKSRLADIISRVAFNPNEHDFMSSRERQRIVRSLEDPEGKFAPKEDVTTWAYRLIKMIKSDPEFTETIKDQQLKDIVHQGMKTEPALTSFWYQLWSKMGKLFIKTEVAEGKVVNHFKDPADEKVKEAVRDLLFVRLHPETQILFKYISPSGYLNEKSPEPQKDLE